MSRESCGGEGSEWQAETPSSPRHSPTLELCPSASLPPSSVHQLQDLAEFPGARWRFYRLRDDRPEGDTEFRVRGDRQPGITPRQTHRATRPGRGGSWKQLPRKPPQCPRTHGGWSCGKFPPLRRVPQFWEGTNRRIQMDQERLSLPRSPQCRPYFPNRTGDLDMGTVHPNQEALCCCFGVRQEVLPAGYGEGLRDIGGRALTLLGRGTITGSWETALMVLGSSE